MDVTQGNGLTAGHNQPAETLAKYGSHFTGKFPKLLNTVRAEVLSRMIGGEHLTGMDAVFDMSTTRLAPVIHELIHRYHWDVRKADRTVNTKDGRVTEICAYYLPETVVDAAMAAGGYEFCQGVLDARRRLRSARGG